MDVKIVPSVFLGKIHHLSDQQKQEYFETLNTFFKDYTDSYVLLVESSVDCSEDEFVLSYEGDFQDVESLKQLELIISGFKTTKITLKTFSDSINYYCSSLHLNTQKVVHLLINETRSQVSMELGKKLQKMRKANYLLVGLGNVTSKEKTNDHEVITAVKEFDSWVRVKLWEFDYYALRDIDTYFPIKRNLYLKEFHPYASFLVVFGSLTGTDVLYDLFTGFEGNTSLRSFYFST